MSGDAEILKLTDVHYAWPGRSGFSLSLPSFSLMRGETVLLLGESGSGKSTLLSLICGTILPQTGSVVVSDTDLSSLSGGGRDQFRAENIGVIFQQFNLLPFATVADNILLPLRFAPERRKQIKDGLNEATSLCASLGLPDDIMTQRAETLSVGQQQRVAVARALIGAPPLIIADEPTSSLDETTRDAFLELLFGQIRTRASSLLMVSHDPRLGDYFDKVIRLDEVARIERTAA